MVDERKFNDDGMFQLFSKIPSFFGLLNKNSDKANMIQIIKKNAESKVAFST